MTYLDYIYKTIFYGQRPYPPGNMVDVGGYRLHVQKSEPKEGAPTIVVETGIYDCSLSWQLVQSKIAPFAQIITYDRAGYGWSERSQKSHTFVQMTKDLHQALKKLEVKPPYILVGHSLGGAIARTYQKRYPKEVAGLVLVDALHNLPPKMPTAFMIAARVASFLAAFGFLYILFKFWGPMTGNDGWTTDMEFTYNYAHRCQPWTLRTCFDESDAMDEGFSQLTPLDNIPITIISRDPALPMRPGMSEEEVEKERGELKELHRKQLEDFEGSRLVIAKGSSHLVQLDRPDIIVLELKRMIQKIKDK